MVFSTTQQQNIKDISPKLSWFERFSDQPHQLFFASSIIFALYSMICTFLSLLGKNLDFVLIHGFALNFGVFTNAFMGFLLTVIPKFSGAKKIEKRSYLSLWIIYEMAIFITLFLDINIGKVIVVLALFYLVQIFYSNIKSGFASDKSESFLLTFLLFLGAFLLLLELIFQGNFSLLIFYGYLLNMVFIVALKMIPNFYSMFTLKPKWQKPKYINFMAIFIFLLMGIFTQFEMIVWQKIISFVALIFFGFIIFKLNIFKKTVAILDILVLSFVWFYLGIIGFFIENVFEIYTLKLSLHIFTLGFVLNLLIGFGSRVIMGHAVPAQKIEADKITIFLFVLTQFIVIFRLFGSLFYLGNFEFFIGFFHLATTLWIVLFVLWLFRYGKILLRIG